MKLLKHLALGAVAVGLLAGATADVSLARTKPCKTLAKIDPDNDGSMTLDEAKKAAGAVFDRINKDSAKDSTLDARELRGRLSEKEIAAGDPDKDKTIDKNEYLSIVEARFKAANKDADSTIECKELYSKNGKALLRLLK
jgi:hypothetical protein